MFFWQSKSSLEPRGETRKIKINNKLTGDFCHLGDPFNFEYHKYTQSDTYVNQPINAAYTTHSRRGKKNKKQTRTAILALLVKAGKYMYERQENMSSHIDRVSWIFVCARHSTSFINPDASEPFAYRSPRYFLLPI